MQLAPIPTNEVDRQAALRRSGILETPDTNQLERLVYFAQNWFESSIAMVSLSDGERQCFPAVSGVPVKEAPRSTSFCGHITASGEPLTVTDARQDQRFCDNPAVVGEPFVRSYSGMPIRFEGHVLGGICVADAEVRQVDDRDSIFLSKLAEAVEREIELLHQTTQDSLTGLLNRNGLMQAGEKLLATAKRDFKPLTALFFDLNGFKHINTAIGHDRADFALKDFAASLKSVCRSSDVCSRRSGDEFIVLMRSEATAATKFCNRLDTVLAECNQQTTLYQLQYSVGVSTLKPKQSFEELLMEANELMFQDKAWRKKAA